MKNFLKTTLIILSSLFLVNCGFQLRSAKQLPPQLHELCLVSSQPNSSFTHKLKQMLNSLSIKIASSCNQTNYELQVYETTLTRDNPAITTADQALTFNYTFSMDFELRDKKGRNLISRRVLKASRTVILNAQQIYTPYNTAAIQKQLEQIILNQLYDQLTITETKNNFVKYSSANYAN